MDELDRRVPAGEIDTVVLALADMQGRLPGRRLTARYLLNEVVPHGAEACNYLLAVDVDMNTVAGYSMSSWETGSRAVRVQSGSRLQAILGDNATVSCSHHQGVDRIGDGLVPVAWDAEDGTVEAMELVDRDFVVAVQSHPEEGGQKRLFGALVAAADAARGATR